MYSILNIGVGIKGKDITDSDYERCKSIKIDAIDLDFDDMVNNKNMELLFDYPNNGDEESKDDTLILMKTLRYVPEDETSHIIGLKELKEFYYSEDDINFFLKKYDLEKYKDKIDIFIYSQMI
jgi:hypothetical protein